VTIEDAARIASVAWRTYNDGPIDADQELIDWTVLEMAMNVLATVIDNEDTRN